MRIATLLKGWHQDQQLMKEYAKERRPKLQYDYMAVRNYMASLIIVQKTQL